jgi:hypothetical protein
MRIALLCCAFLSACNVRPTVTFKPDGSVVATTGGSLMTKSKTALAHIKLPNGTEIAYREDGKDETVVPVRGLNTWGTVAVAGILEEGLTSRTAIPEQGMTARQVSSDSVKKAKIDGDVKIKTFVPPETAPAVAAP